MTNRDWWEWHRPYDDPSSPLSQRLAAVRGHLGAALEGCPPGPTQVISMCAGQGRDIVGVLADHPRRGDVCARLVELDERNFEFARRSAAEAGLDGVEVVKADAGTTDVYLGAVPAQVVLACGIFGNITDEDIQRTVMALPTLGAAGAVVIWTRHRRPPDLTPLIRAWFDAAGFAEVAFGSPEGTSFGVGVNMLEAQPRSMQPGQRFFTFVGYDQLDPSNP